LKKENSISSDDFDCIVNKTPLSARTNRIIGGDAPSKYLPRIETTLNTNKTGVGNLLQTHFINPEYLYSDNFYGFFNQRKIELLKLIGKAMGKEVDPNNSDPDYEITISAESDEIEIDDETLEFN